MGDVALLLSYPPDRIDSLSPKEYDKVTNEYLDKLSKQTLSFWTKQYDGLSLFELLNPAVNSIPYLIALQHHIRTTSKDQKLMNDMLEKAQVFFSIFDARQIRYVGEPFAKVLGWFFEAFYNSTDLSPLSAAMLRLDPTGGTFTVWHIFFLRICLANGVPSQALPIIDNDIYAFAQTPVKGVYEDIPAEDSELSNSFITQPSGFAGSVHPEMFLEYYLLGAFVYIGRRNWARARLFLEHVILTPAHQHSVSALQVEAYKKWLLVGLVDQGKPYPIPRTLDQQVLKSLQAMSREYDALARNVEKRDSKKFSAEAEVGAQMWYQDGNATLVREAEIALQKYRIVDLQKTYAALPTGRVAALLEMQTDATLQMLTDLIRSGDLNASITPGGSGPSDAVLRFHAMPAVTLNAAQQEQKLQAQTARIESIITYIRDADRRVKLTKEYAEHERRLRRQGQGPDGDLAEQMDLTWDAPIPGPMGDDGDEDIMA